MPLCVIQGRTNSDTECFTGGRAGISHMFVNSSTNVTGLTFDADRKVSAITVDATEGKGFKRFEFDEDTAFLSQDKTRTADGKGGTNVAVTLSINIAGMATDDLNKLENLNQFRELHIIAVDNDGKRWYVGVSYYEDTDTYKSEKLRTAAGSANTGTDPVNDAKEAVETFTCNQTWYCREVALEESAIPVT